jgi:hypothetical protein
MKSSFCVRISRSVCGYCSSPRGGDAGVPDALGRHPLAQQRQQRLGADQVVHLHQLDE